MTRSLGIVGKDCKRFCCRLSTSVVCVILKRGHIAVPSSYIGNLGESLERLVPSGSTFNPVNLLPLTASNVLSYYFDVAGTVVIAHAAWVHLRPCAVR